MATGYVKRLLYLMLHRNRGLAVGLKVRGANRTISNEFGHIDSKVGFGVYCMALYLSRV